MADPWTIGLGVASVASSVLGGKSAKKAAKKAAKKQIEAVRTQRKEERRQMKQAAAVEYGAGRAAIGASNIQFSGSPQRYLDNLNMQNMREIAYHKMAQRKEEEAIRAGASGVATPFYAQAAGDAIGYAARAFASSLTPKADPGMETDWWAGTDPFGPSGMYSGGPNG